MRIYYTYILASRSRTLYIGMTGNIAQRMSDHKAGVASDFTRKYKIHRLVYYEEFLRPMDAILCEKHWKGWTRARKIALIESINPTWEDLAENWEDRYKPDKQVLCFAQHDSRKD